MKNKRIEGSLSKTINLGNYESMKVSVGLSGDIQDSESIREGYRELFKQVELELKSRIKMLGLE